MLQIRTPPNHLDNCLNISKEEVPYLEDDCVSLGQKVPHRFMDTVLTRAFHCALL
jgi:hypothetical protein